MLEVIEILASRGKLLRRVIWVKINSSTESRSRPDRVMATVCYGAGEQPLGRVAIQHHRERSYGFPQPEDRVFIHQQLTSRARVAA